MWKVKPSPNRDSLIRAHNHEALGPAAEAFRDRLDFLYSRAGGARTGLPDPRFGQPQSVAGTDQYPQEQSGQLRSAIGVETNFPQHPYYKVGFFTNQADAPVSIISIQGRRPLEEYLGYIEGFMSGGQRRPYDASRNGLSRTGESGETHGLMTRAIRNLTE